MARDKDTVIFMSAYETTKYSKVRKLFPPKVDVAKLLKKHHISYLMYQNKIIAPDGILELNPEYDDVAQETTYTYEAIGKDNSIDNYDELINHTGACIKLMHSCAVLTDPAYFRIDHVFGLESFIVYIDDAVFQIDPLVFSFNRAYIVAYEMIDLATGMPLGRDDTSPKMRNWNLRKIKGYKYFNEDFSNLSNYTIPELIFTHVSDYFYELVGKRFAPNDYTYVHDTLVISNSVRNVDKYFNKCEFECPNCGAKVTTYIKPIMIKDYDIKFKLFSHQEYENLRFCSESCRYAYVEKEHKRLMKDQNMEFDPNEWISVEQFTRDDIAGYIYKISKKSTGEFYIGQTIHLPIFRWGQHLKTDRFHHNGINDYQFEVLEIVPKSKNILEVEKEYSIKWHNRDVNDVMFYYCIVIIKKM